MKKIFLLSFLPAIAYWYLEAHYDLTTALVGGLGLAVLELTLEWIFTRHLHTLSKFNFFLLVILGAISLAGDEGIWFKLQPAFSAWGMAAFLGYKLWRGEGMMAEMARSMAPGRAMPSEMMRTLEIHLTVFLALYGSWMTLVAIALSSNYWIFFKTAGFYLIFALFFIFEVIYIRIKVRTIQRLNYQRTVMAQYSSHYPQQEQYGPRSQTKEKN